MLVIFRNRINKFRVTAFLSVESALDFAMIVYAVYLLISVNKDWSHYWLPLALFVPWSIAFKIRYLPQKWAIVSVSMLLLSNSSLWVTNSHLAYGHHHFSDERVEIQRRVADLLVQSADLFDSDGVPILVSAYTSVPFDALGLDFEEVRIIWGPFRSALVDETTGMDRVPSLIVLSYPNNTLNTRYERHPDAIALRADWDALHNGHLGYELRLQDDDLSIFVRK